MEAPQPDTENPDGPASGARRFAGLPVALLRYLEARGVLLSVEAQEAAEHLLRVLLRGLLAAIFGFTGWLALNVGLVSYLAGRNGWCWEQVAVGVALANLVAAVILGYAGARRVTSTRWFEHTLKEFGKDRAWLARLNDKH